MDYASILRFIKERPSDATKVPEEDLCIIKSELNKTQPQEEPRVPQADSVSEDARQPENDFAPILNEI